MSSTSQPTTFADLRYCSRCMHNKDVSCFSPKHAWCRECKQDYAREHKRKPTAASYQENRERRLYSRFRMSVEQYELLLEEQGRRCAVCKADNNHPYRTFDIDHCHQTRKIRGLLCRRCNTGLGQFGDSIDNLLKACDYLAGFQ